MNNPVKIIFILTITCLMVIIGGQSHAQFFKKLKESVQEAAEETINRKAEEKTEKETEAAFDSLLNSPSKNGNEKYEKGGGHKHENEQESRGNGEYNNEDFHEPDADNSLEVYRKFDFVPGEKIILFDDFSQDNMGDFPSKWDTNGSGELVSFSGYDQKWLKLVNKSIYIPIAPSTLPEDCTIEFDIVTIGVDRQTTTAAKLFIQLDEDGTFNKGKNRASIALPFAQYVDAGIYVENYVNGSRVIYNDVKADIREQLKDVAHISMAINKRRFRLWVDDKKAVDIPRLLPESGLPYVKLMVNYFKDGKESIYISNFKIAAGGVDLRHQLISEGKFSTSGILFDVNSSTIRPESYGVIKNIANVLLNNPGISVMIIGHTDSDGDDQSNLVLSKQRANSVKNLLVAEFGIDEYRITTNGKGEGEPIDTNSTSTGKANNRRVEFIKM